MTFEENTNTITKFKFRKFVKHEKLYLSNEFSSNVKCHYISGAIFQIDLYGFGVVVSEEEDYMIIAAGPETL